MTLPIGSIAGYLRLIGGAEFDSGIVGAQRSLNLAGKSARDFAGSLDMSDTAMARARSTSMSASAAAQKFRAAQLSAAAATERYNTALASGTASTARLASAEASMIRANAKVAESMRTTAAVQASLFKAQTEFAAKASAVGGKISRGITLPAAVAAAVSVDQAMKFQKSMTLIQTAGGETAAKTAKIAAGIKTVAQSTGTALSDLSEGIYTVAKAGATKWSATDQVNVLRVAAQGAKAENVDLGTSVDALTSVMLGYGISAKDAVKAENQIIRASGLSKTSMQEFAGSLANVIPLASSLHISFAEVAGAEATMTQHGETAQRATENLSNLITNLAGQNHVAAQAMQQLGINTVDLQKHLAQNGLTGTLAIVEDHIAKSSKAGMVVVSAFKQAQNATHDLDIELGHMSGTLKTNSQAFANGSMSYKDYRAYVRSLGGDQYALGQNFMTTVTAAKGFNSQLKSGDADVRTTAASLQKMLGGVTGMRTALMLSGNSASQFASNVKEVQKASLLAGADVLGWNKTQETLAVKTDKAKASLQVLAVEVGDTLLPAMGALATKGEDAVQWIDNLSHTQKEMLGWGLGVLAALGPVLSMGARLTTLGAGIGRFVTGATTSLTTLAGVSEATSVRIATSMRLTTAALAGAGVGLALGEITKNSSDTTKAVGVLGSTLTGAAIGFGVGGPWGAAIGGAAGGLSDLAIGFFDSGTAAKDAAQKQVEAAQRAKKAILDQKRAVDALVSSLQADNDAVAANTRLTVENDLQKSGAFTLAEKLGISTKTVTNAVLGHAKAQQQLAAAAAKLASKPGLLGAGQSADLAKLNGLLADEGVNLHKAAVTADEYAEANGKLKLAARSVAEQFALYGHSLDADTAIGKQNLRFIDSHIAALTNQRAAGKLTTAGFDGQLIALSKQLSAYRYSTAQVGAFTRALQRVPKRVLTNVEKHGVTANEIQAIIDKYGDVPKSKKTDIGVRDKASPALTDVGQLIGDLTGQPYTVRVGADVSEARSAIAELHAWLNGLRNKTITVTEYSNLMQQTGHGNVSQHATGGTVVGQGGPTSDSVVARLSPGEEVIRASQAEKHRGLLKAINAGTAGFASGGTVGVGVAGHLSGVNAQGAAQVISAIMAAVRPAPSTAAGIAGQLLRQEGGATSRNIAADSALAAYRKEAAALKAVTKATNEQVAAAKHEATQAGITARKAKQAAEAMPSATKAERAAKSAAEDHARALQQLADKAGNVATKVGKAAAKEQAAAQATADKGKAAYSKLEAAAKAATQVAAQTAQNLVASIQSQFDTLQQNYDDMKSTISGGLTAGSDLSTIWGQLGDTVSTTSDALDQAQQALRSAQDAVAQATPDMSALADAQSAAASAASQLAAAQRDVAAANSSGDTARIVSAQNELTAAMTASTSAHAALVQAQSGAASQSGPTVDQLQAVADAQDKLTAAQQAYTAAKAADSASGVASVLSGFDDSEKQFAGDLTHLKSMIGDGPAAQALITELTGLGDKAGDALAEGLINDPASLRSILASMQQIQSIADGEGTALATSFYASGAQSMMQLMQGIEDEYPSVAAGLAPYAAQLAQMFNIPMPTPPSSAASGAAGKSVTHAADIASYYLVNDTANGKWYDVNPTLKTVHELTDAEKQRDLAAGATVNVRTSGVPHFASGTWDAPGGPSLVGEMGAELVLGPALVNLPRHAGVVPNNVLKGASAFGGADPAVLQRLAAIEAHSAATSRKLDAIASLPVIGQAAVQGLQDANHLHGMLESV